MYVPVTKVKPLDGYKLQLKFKNGEEKIFDLSPYLKVGKFAELKDVALFNSATVRFDSIEWANHVDLDPEFLYEHSSAIKTRTTRTSERGKKSPRVAARR